MRSKGRITEWNDPRGFGFITPLKGGNRVFVHISSFPTNHRRPDGGEFVSYDLQTDERGRPQAVSVMYAIERSTDGEVVVRQATAVSLMISGLFLVGVVVLAITEILTWLVPPVYLILSLVAYLIYKADKKAAAKGSRRTPEVNLLFVGLIGGWPGALFAQHSLRHKNRKILFQVMYWFTVGLNIAVLSAFVYAADATK